MKNNVSHGQVDHEMNRARGLGASLEDLEKAGM